MGPGFESPAGHQKIRPSTGWSYFLHQRESPAEAKNEAAQGHRSGRHRLCASVLGLPCGNIVLSVAVLSILITAPLGAFGMDLSSRRLLNHEKV